jgi:FlaA1/EpsC-like NDP-sugar epimerase
VNVWFGRMICVTGAGGSVGSKLCETLCERGADVLALDHSELALYLLIERIGNAEMVPHIADVRDKWRLHHLFDCYRPSVVFNCAALKHVPMCERDASECWETNAYAFARLCYTARDTGVRAVIQISTDKAVDPTSELGHSKRQAEETAASYCGADFRVAAVRFHNILGSSGSVMQKFLAQIEVGGPVTVTHPEMVRTFGTAADACEKLMLCAEHAMGPGGCALYALDTGTPIRIVDLARYLIGEKPIEIVYSGIRPGERLEEKLVGRDERAIDIGIDGILGIEPASSMRSAGGDRRGSAGDGDQIWVHPAP